MNYLWIYHNGFIIVLLILCKLNNIGGMVGKSHRPHIIYILADDMGWNDVSYHGQDQVPTPNIDSLGYHGVILNRHYVQPTCTPSRASLLTGKHPVHTGQHFPSSPSQKSALPLEFKILPEYLKELGYKTHMIGKWHLGYYEKKFTPLQRGFDSHFGYWAGIMSYYDHITEDMGVLQKNFTSYSGFSLRRNYDVAWDVAGQYATDLFTEEAVKLINNHPSESPMFLYLAHLAVHAGNRAKSVEAPQEEINKFSHIINPNRKSYAAMVSKLDQSVGDVLEALQKKDMLKNSIVIFVSDNGAPVVGNYINFGSNYPWRGQKGTFFEGGIRTPALVWSPLIRKKSRVSQSLMHMTDWLPTLLAVAGYNCKDLDIDGVNQWQTISYGYSDCRNFVLIDAFEEHDMYGLILNAYKYVKGATSPGPSLEKSKYLNFDTITSRRSPKYNLQQILTCKAWTAVESFSKDKNLPNRILSIRKEATIKCDHNISSTMDCDSSPCLFNIIQDPCEASNLASSFPVLTKHMEDVINKFKTEFYPEDPYFLDPAANPALHNDSWSIWVN